MDQIVIFGASGGAIKVAKTFQNMGLEIAFFIDNDKNKIGKMFEGKPIKDPMELAKNPSLYKVVIASTYYGEIEEQLIQLGIAQENIVLKEQYILEYINVHGNELRPSIKPAASKTTKDILIDLSEGFILGGIEKWSITLAKILSDHGHNITILTKDEPSDRDISTNGMIKKFDLSFDRYMESVKELAEEIITKLPCVVIVNRIAQVYMAAYIVKKMYPEQLQILSVIHSDFIRMYKQNELIEKDVDAFLCVSNEVMKHFIEQTKVDQRKVYYKDSPILIPLNHKKSYSASDHPIIIGYGGRLEKAQKRADLIIPLVKRLEEMKIPYKLYIAGDGSYRDKIKDFVMANGLECKIVMFGTIPYTKMIDFWSKCDIFLNLSDIEGLAISMLEAMAVGAVPVVTDTSGTESFISNGSNGYVNHPGDIDAIAKCIQKLCENREQLAMFGSICRETIRAKCNPESYLEFLHNLLDIR